MVLGPDLERFGETQTKLQNMVERAQRLLASTAVVAGDESATAGLAKDSKKGLPDPNSVNTPTSAMASRVPPGLPDSSAAFADGAVGAASSSEHAEAIESVRANANRAVIGELSGATQLCASARVLFCAAKPQAAKIQLNLASLMSQDVSHRASDQVLAEASWASVVRSWRPRLCEHTTVKGCSVLPTHEPVPLHPPCCQL